MTEYDLMPILIPGVFMQVLVMSWYIKHCWENPRLSTRQKAFWIVLIALGNIPAAAFYLLITKPKSTIASLPTMATEPTATSQPTTSSLPTMATEPTATAQTTTAVQPTTAAQPTSTTRPTTNTHQNPPTSHSHQMPLSSDEESPYSAASQSKQAIIVFLIVAFEVFALRMLFENQEQAGFYQLTIITGLCFVLMIVISLLVGRIRSDWLRLGLPFVLMALAGGLIYFDTSNNSLVVILAFVALLINSYPLTWAKVYFVAFFTTYIVAMLLQAAHTQIGPVLMTDQLISALYSDILFFILVFAAFYSLKKQYQLNHQLELVLEMTRSQAQELRELSVLSERQRIIGEIHDTVGHTLTTAVIALEDGGRLLDLDAAAARGKIELAHRQTRQSLDDLRNAIRTMQTGENNSFEERLHLLVAEIIRTTELEVSEIVELETSPLPIQQNVFLNSVKEFATNSLKHGKSQAIDILLQEFDQSYHLTISDDGEGTDDINFGFGLSNIRNRAESLGGTMKVESSVGEGFSLQVTLPAGRAND